MVNDILGTAPMDATQSGTGATATQDQKDYGLCIAAMSQCASTLGMGTKSSGVVTALMNDASDGVMNGMAGSTAVVMPGMTSGTGGGMGGGMGGGTMSPTAGTSGLASAMSSFLGSATNHSGVTVADMQALMSQLTASNGTIP
jgi:hypothetical protein